MQPQVQRFYFFSNFFFSNFHDNHLLTTEGGRNCGCIVSTKCFLHIFWNSKSFPSVETLFTTSNPWDAKLAFSLWVSIVAACEIISGVKAEALKCSCTTSENSWRFSSGSLLPGLSNALAADLTFLSSGSCFRRDTVVLTTTKETSNQKQTSTFKTSKRPQVLLKGSMSQVVNLLLE